jgi:hypothetical protein
MLKNAIAGLVAGLTALTTRRRKEKTARRPQIIGLAGPARVGKDTIAANMPGWTRRAFADELKADLAPLAKRLGLDMANPEHKELLRPLMVEYGRLARKVDPDYWLKRLKLTGADRIVITDVRYANEVRFIQQQGGSVYLVRRDGYTPANDEERTSLAEIALMPAIPVVNNGGTPADAVYQVVTMHNVAELMREAGRMAVYDTGCDHCYGTGRTLHASADDPVPTLGPCPKCRVQMS